MGKPHAIVVPYPVQGHIIPHMELAHRLVERGFKITFVNTEVNHKRIAATLQNQEDGQINMVSIPDGLSEDSARNDLGTLSKAMMHVFPKEVEQVIEKINATGKKNEKIACIVSDMGWVLEVGDKMGLQTVNLWTVSAELAALVLDIPKLIDDGIINPDGTLIKDQMIQLSPEMPFMETKHFVWLCMGDLNTQKLVFDVTVKNNQAIKVATWNICNSSYALEPAAFAKNPDILPIGPLLGSSLGKSLGHFWAEDSACLNWLNLQPPKSVIYVAFGSFTIFGRIQFQELALGLELSGRRFLWVVRPDMTDGSSDAYPEGFQDRVVTQGQMVGWAPQQKVLSHPSVACFVTHCGWNSTMESLGNGVPCLCWPYFADQFHNQSQICDVWKVGLRLDKNETGVVVRNEIKKRVNELLCNDGIRRRTSELMEAIEKSVSLGGSSSRNFDNLVTGLQKR